MGVDFLLTLMGDQFVVENGPCVSVSAMYWLFCYVGLSCVYVIGYNVNQSLEWCYHVSELHLSLRPHLR